MNFLFSDTLPAFISPIFPYLPDAFVREPGIMANARSAAVQASICCDCLPVLEDRELGLQILRRVSFMGESACFSITAARDILQGKGYEVQNTCGVTFINNPFQQYPLLRPHCAVEVPARIIPPPEDSWKFE
ncbi:hypothetical protein CEXT_552701 [Caerostris extrusa]|uniref:Uncharacterized protein n=1 Tax=Caerostris extrusa TaxID=172846 RepID=A0AAV4UWZ9_CAEEX|nr:hypothetical protein CEXT_552701 [Caerostris extrusa]